MLLAFAVAVPQASAQITYVDAIATAGMSTAANGNPPINTMISPNSSPGSTIAAAAAESETLWRIRGLQGASAADGGTDTANFAINGNAIQNGINSTTTPAVLNLELVTTATGLDPSKVTTSTRLHGMIRVAAFGTCELASDRAARSLNLTSLLLAF